MSLWHGLSDALHIYWNIEASGAVSLRTPKTRLVYDQNCESSGFKGNSRVIPWILRAVLCLQYENKNSWTFITRRVLAIICMPDKKSRYLTVFKISIGKIYSSLNWATLEWLPVLTLYSFQKAASSSLLPFRSSASTGYRLLIGRSVAGVKTH